MVKFWLLLAEGVLSYYTMTANVWKMLRILEEFFTVLC